MILSAIAAMSENRVIGVNNELPWSIPEDLKFFRDTTKESIMIMGRKTFDSIKQPLPGRFHIIVTRNPDFKFEHERVAVVQSLDAAIPMAAKMIPPWRDEVFVVGGGEIYQQVLHRLDRIYLTLIHREYKGDAKFPEFENSGRFTIIEKIERPMIPEKGQPAFEFQTWKRK